MRVIGTADAAAVVQRRGRPKRIEQVVVVRPGAMSACAVPQKPDESERKRQQDKDRDEQDLDRPYPCAIAPLIVGHQEHCPVPAGSSAEACSPRIRAS
jgi:hypothetical protein